MTPISVNILLLVITPILASVLLMLSNKQIMRWITALTMLFTSGVSLFTLFNISEGISIEVPHFMNNIMFSLDVILLVFFVFIALKHKSWLITIFSFIQAALFINLTISVHNNNSLQEIAPIYVNNLSVFMYLLINIVSAVILIYALKYIEDEGVSLLRQKKIMATLLWFVGVMNFIVSVDNIEWFFLLFELTTLASYILIKFRQDPISNQNAVKALWMNQIGGIAILIAMIYSVNSSLSTMSFNLLVTNTMQSHIMLPVTLIAVAVMIKGAQMPFSNWLLGAMAAPTPVSALLHSSTMVKIAPFILIKLSPALKDTVVGYLIIILCSFVFVIASLAALSKQNFKIILAQSTIALLALMMMMAVYGTETATTAALILILFHGISKCLLFLNAGILEKVFHIKQIYQTEDIAKHGPLTVIFIVFGFLSLLLPPFGAFYAKWLSLESLTAGTPMSKMIGVIAIVSVALGSAILTFLYMRVIGVLIMRKGDTDKTITEKMSPFYKYSPIALIIMLLASAIGFAPLVLYFIKPIVKPISLLFNNNNEIISIKNTMYLSFTNASEIHLGTILVTILLLPLGLMYASKYIAKGDRVKEYTCGEKIELEIGSYYFNFDKLNIWFLGIGSVLFIAIIIAGRI